MHRALVLSLALLLVGSGVGFSLEQAVEPIVPPGEQQIETIVPPGEQAIERVATGAEQQVEPQVAPTPTEKTVSNVAKAVTGVAAAAAALGATAAMLLFF
jgi:hypothetical protein